MSAFDHVPCVLDGRVRPDGVIPLRATAEALTHGEGLFESLPVIDGRPKFLPAHVRRLDHGARALGFGPGPTEADVLADVGLLIAACGGGTFSMRLVLFREGAAIRRLATADAMPAEAGRPVALVVAAKEFDGPRALGRYKTLNYLVPRLAHREAAARGADEALFTTHDGLVLEGTRSTLFLVTDGVLRTPPLSLPILPGVTRDVILAAAAARGVPVREETFPVGELFTADEVFISASVRGLRPVATFEGRPLRGVGGKTTRTLQDGYAAAFAAG